MPQHVRAELSEEDLLLSPAASSDGEPLLSCLCQLTACLMTYQLNCVCAQVNLLPGLIEAFSNVGGGLCHFYTHFQLTGKSAAGKSNQLIDLD